MSNPVEGLNVYLCGPITGMPNHNREAFARAERRVMELGAKSVFNPIEWWGHVDRPREWYMRGDIHMLTGSADGTNPTFGAIVALPGYMAHPGSRTEVLVANACGIEFVRYVDLLGLPKVVDVQ